jgi:hypothetical protein
VNYPEIIRLIVRSYSSRDFDDEFSFLDALDEQVPLIVISGVTTNDQFSGINTGKIMDILR